MKDKYTFHAPILLVDWRKSHFQPRPKLLNKKFEHLLQHRDYGNYVIEFCASHKDCLLRKIYGKEAEKIRPLLNQPTE